MVRRMRSSEKPLTSLAGTYWLKAIGRPSAPKHTASSRPSSRGSKIRLKRHGVAPLGLTLAGLGHQLEQLRPSARRETASMDS